MAEALDARAARRRTGVAYLAMILFTLAGYSTLTRLLTGDPDEVLARLSTSHTVLALAIAASVIGFVAWLVFAILFYRLVGSFGRMPGLLMLVLVAAGMAMNLYVLSQLLPLVHAAAQGMDAATFAQVAERYRHQGLLAQVFSGLWMFPLGWLVLRSGIAPGFVAWSLMLGGVGYLMAFATAFEPGLGEQAAFQVVGYALFVPAMIGELGLCFWLLFRGPRVPAS